MFYQMTHASTTLRKGLYLLGAACGVVRKVLEKRAGGVCEE